MRENHWVGLALFMLCIVGFKPSLILAATNASDSEFPSSLSSPSKVSIFP